MLNPNTTLNENTETGDVPENLKIEAPELYETPDYTLPNEPSSYERKGFGFDQSNANKEDFIKYVYASRLIRERGGDEMLRRGGVMNCLYSINNMYRYIPANEAYREFFGGDIPIEQAEAELDRLYDIAANSEDALGKFLKLDDARQEKIIRQNVQGGRVKKAYTATGSSGGAIVADIDNPDFDMGKGREEYENILRAKNTWEGYLQLRNNFSPEVVRDAMRFKTATAESRSNVAEAVLIKMREKGPEYRAAFLASLDVLGVNIKDASDHNFFERAFTRISEAWTDSGVNMADKFWYSRTDGRVLYGMAEEMGLIDESGNLTEDASKLGKLKQAYEDSQNTAAIRALGSAGGWGSKPAYKDTEIQKLFDEGKENIETRRMYRNLRANLATQYNYSGDEWKTLEDMFVYGEYTLRAIGVSAATLAATKNPFMASLASVPMMFAEETARMYSELRLDAGLTESQASLLAMQYGVAVSAAEQFQLGRFMGSFVGKSAAKSFKEYVFNNFKGGVKKAIKESALETGVELSQNTYDLSTKIFATEAFGAGFNTDQLLDNYVEDFKSAALITPLITTFIFGVGAPFRFSGTLSNVGANYGTVAKTLLGIKPSEVVENNVETFETIRAAGEYEALVKSKYGATEQGRDFLLKYLNAKDSVERNSILQKRFPDAKERAEAKLFLENFKRLDSEAFDSILKVKIEAAQKREAEAQSILKGDTTDISALDAETTDEAGNISYEILNSAIDALGMRDDVVFVNNAQELAQASGMSLNAAEDVISRKGAKGFFDEKNGKIAIIKSHFASGADALQSFAHEYGHKIMAKIRANDLNGYKRMCSDVLDLIGGEAVARASLPASYSQVGHANYAKDSLDVAEESLMRVLEQVALKRVLDARKKSVWARFKGWFQKLFSEKSLADITNERLAQIALDVLQKEKSFNVSVPNAPSRNWRAKTPEADGEYVSGEWEVVDAGDLKTSLDTGYDDALQPRNRGRQSSKEQVLNIANNLDPELLDNDPRTSDGAPIVDSRSMAVSGNGRILAIRQAYESGKAEEYRRHVLSRANSMGIDVPAGIKNPVLIRRVMDTGNMSIEELAARSNKSSVAGMSVAEQAVADGRRISEAGLLDIFFPGADGNILAESNRDFNNAFLNLVGGSETFRNKDGSLRTNLSPRVRAAVLAAMLNTGGNRDIVERLLDNPEGYNALINGLMQCAANLAELAQKPQYDISGELSQAVELYIEMHDKGQTVAEFEAQPDMFREQPSAEVMFLCRLFEANQKSPSGISGVLKEYAAQCKKIDTTTADLFGEEDPSKLDKLQAAYDHYATDLAQGMDNLRALDRGNSAYANFDERKLNDKETLQNLTPEEILERIKSVKSVSFPVERLDENFNLKYYWNWFEKNLLDREIPTAIRRNAVFKKGHFFKLIAGGKNKGFIKGYTTPEDAFKAIKKGKVLLHDKDLAPEGFSMARARQMPLVLDVLQDPFFVLKDKKTKDFIFLKKYEGGGNYVAVMFNANPLGIVSWQMRDFTLSNARRSTLEYQKNGVDFLAQPRESSMRDDSPKTLSESENNSENQENSSKKWREVSEPSPEEIAEANRQKAEVKAKWTNPDGSMKKGYMLAPNGKPTNLSEDQWLQVRTPNFKKWFGDWETLAEAYPENEIFDIDEAYKFARKNLQGGSFTSKDGYGATLGREGIDKMNSGLARGKTANNRLHALAFANIGKLFGNSELLKTEPPRDGNTNIKRYLKFYAPLYMDGLYAVKITVKELSGNNGNRLYSIEGLDITKESEYRGQSRGSKENSIPADYSDSVNNFVKKLREVKGKVSKVVDENGEPLAVYHGTPKFDRFNIFKKGSGGYLGPAIYFTNLKTYAQKYENKWGDGGNLYDVFLSLRNSLVVKSINPAKEILKTIYGKDGIYDKRSQKQSYDTKILSSADIKKLQSKGYDGVIWEYGGSKEYAVYDSSKIKSATDNIGTFNTNNPDIRWREVSEPSPEEIAAIDKRHAELYERYKNGDISAYDEAVELVRQEAENKGYETQAYHGTGADAFNVALADSSKSEYGEGNQAHGPGLYMAANRDTAEAYKYNAPVQEFRTIGGKTFEEIGISPKELNYPVFGLVDFLHSNGVDKAKEIINTRIESQTKRLKSAEKHLPKSKDGFDRDLAWETIKSARREISNDRITLDVIDKILSKLKKNGLSISDYEYKISEGRVFDWLHNMKSDELLDEQNPNSVEKSAVGEKYKKAWFEDILPILRREYGYDEEELDSVKRMLSFHNSAKTIARNGSTILGADRFREIMLKHGIRGITYNGRQDGRVFVSFEGGPAVKLQDAFTFDDNGELIPLSKRFDASNPDMRWREVSETKRAADEWANNSENVRKLTEEYLAEQKGQIVVDPDRIRAKLPNYEVSLNSDFVEAGDNVLEEVWKEALKRAPKDKPVVLLTGNPAAGKGTAKETGLLDWVVEANLVFDAPQNKFTSVEKRVKEAANAGHSVRIILIYNDPVTSWKNSLKRGIGKDNPKTGKREGGRFLPLEYFVRVYESAQGKVEKIENILKQNYKDKLETKYIDNTGNNPIVVSPDEALAWNYSISDDQLKEIEGITDEYRGRIEESARLRGDKKDPLAVIGRGISQSLAISLRGSAERIPGRNESGYARTEQSLPGEGGEGRGPVSRLKALLRQERSENPVIWASIVLAREILLGRPITSAKIDKVLPQGKFDGTKRQYALDRAKHIAEHCKATQKNYANRIDEAVKLAEIDVYWKHDVMEEMYRSYRKDGEEYGIAKQKLLDWIKNEQRKDLEKVKGFSSDELGIDVPAEIENALQEEPVRKKAEESQGETEDKEEIESIAEDGIDDEILGTREKLAPSSLREIIDKIRIAVTKKVKARGGDEQTRRRVYRNTLVEVLSESAKELTYGRERELIQQNIRGLGNLAYHNANSLQARAIELKNKRDLAEKDKSLKSDYIETYNNIQGIYFGTYSGRGGVMNYFVKNYLDNPSQIPDPYSIYAEHIALRIFNRGVRDSKAQLLERFSGIIKRKGKKPSRMERDDKRKMAGAVQMRIYKIGKFAEMDAAELEAEYFAAVDKLNNAGVHFAGDSDNGETNKDFTDIEDIRAEAANTIADIQRFGNLREKSRADMAGAVEFLEKHIEEEMQKQEELIAKKKEEAAKKRKVVSDALRMSKHNAHKDGAFRSGGRALINKTMPFDSLLAVLGEYATGETFLAFDAWRKDLVARIDRAAALVANETFRAQERLINIVEECYSENFSDALKRLLKPDAKYEEFSNLGGESEGMKQPMSLANVLQLYASALQENYRQNVYAHRAKKNGDVEKLQMKIDEILESYPDKESKKGEGWKSASEEIKSLENRIVGLQKNAVSDYIERIEKILTDADKKFVELLRKEYADALPALSAVSRRVIGLPIEQADALYIPVKIKREKTFGEAAGQVPVVPKILSPRVQHMRDFDETANPISLYLDRVRENAQFKYFSELYIEMRSIFGSEELQDLISQRCGSNTLQELLDFVVDISTGQTRGYKDEYIQKANGLFALVALGFNLGSGVRQILPGCFSWGTYIGTPSVLKNMAAFFTPEGFSAALEIWRSENGRRRFSIGNLQIMEEMLATPDQNKFWALFKRYALVFNRASDMLAISFVGQGVYRAGVENYLRQGFNEAKAKEKAMADMWQIAERTQASGRMHNMARWQRRGGDLGKGIGMFSAPPQLMFSKSAQDIRRAIALGIKTPEGRVAAWQAMKTWATVSILVEGSYAASGVLWNALLKGFFDDDDDERIIKQMATGPFGGLFLFGRMIENSTSNRGIESIMPVAGLARPAGNIYDLTLDLMTFDLDKALEDLDKLGKSTVPLYRDFRKVIDNRILEKN